MRYKLEFERDFSEDLVTRQIEEHIDLALETCLHGVDVDLSSIRVYTEETVTPF